MTQMGHSKAAAAALIAVSILLATVSMSMGADAAAAASDVVPAEVRVGTVVLVGSLAQPEPVYFDYNRCVPAPEIAKGASSGGGGMADVLVWWDVFSERTMCNAVQLFASPDCSGAPAAKYQNTAYMSTFKMGASVKSIRCVLDNICRKAKCPKNSTCIRTKDSQEVGCQCAQGYRDVYGQCKPQ